MNVFELAAVLKLNKSEFDKGLDDAESSSKSFGSKVGSALGGAAKAVGVGVAAAAAGVTALTKQSVEAYADYEQLTGGVETLFGAGGQSLQEYAEKTGQTTEQAKKKYDELMKAQDIVMANSAEAYKTAGLSANDYMETVTGFSASLIQSVGGDTVEAANLSNQAVIDMSDNANKMGTSMESIQNAYQGFAKQNYTMLDNLKLGYGGTAGEMYRLLEDASKLDEKFAETADYSMDAAGHLEVGFDDVVKAIHIVQDNLGITGTTSKEASETISGSIGMAKAAWENLVTGISDPNADIGLLVGNMIESAGTALGNLLPVIQQALEGIGTAVTELAPQLSDTIVSLITETAPSLIEAAGTLILTLTQAIIDNLPEIMNTGMEIILSLIQGISEQLPEIINSGHEALMTLVQGIQENLPEILLAGLDLIIALAEGIADNLPELIPAVIEAVMTIATALTEPERLEMLIQAGLDLMAALAVGLLKALPDLLKSIVEVFKNIGTALGEKLAEIYLQWEEWHNELHEKIVGFLKGIFDKVKEWIGNLISKVVEFFGNIKEKISDKFSEIKDKIKEKFEELKEKFKTWAKDMMDNFVNGLKEGIDKVVAKIKEFAQKIKDLIGFSEPKEGPLSDFHTYAPDMVDLFIDGVQKNQGKLQDAVSDAFDFGRPEISPYISATASSTGASDQQREWENYMDKIIRKIDDNETALGKLLLYLKNGNSGGGMDFSTAWWAYNF